ncbi:hypothetical protein CGRA01v4_09508 [Colletotrichum graminicola]|nr:hypothetical protein CGRA01v4_09508 [Colletotrichum graminicola]
MRPTLHGVVRQSCGGILERFSGSVSGCSPISAAYMAGPCNAKKDSPKINQTGYGGLVTSEPQLAGQSEGPRGANRQERSSSWVTGVVLHSRIRVRLGQAHGGKSAECETRRCGIQATTPRLGSFPMRKLVKTRLECAVQPRAAKETKPRSPVPEELGHSSVAPGECDDIGCVRGGARYFLWVDIGIGDRSVVNKQFGPGESM